MKPEGTLSLRAYAKHRGCALSAVQRAIESGRLSKSVARGEQGRARILDALAADREWARTTDASRVPHTVMARKRAAAAADPRAPLLERLEGLMRELQDDTRAIAARYLPHLLDAAAAALAGAGRPATGKALAVALDLDREDAAVELVGELLEAVDDPGMPSDDAIREVARRAGRRAVLGKEAADEG